MKRVGIRSVVCGVLFALLALTGCVEEPGLPDGVEGRDASGLLAGSGAATTAGRAHMRDGSRATAGLRVLGEFEAVISPEAGLVHVEMLDVEAKSASQAVPGMAQDLQSNENEMAMAGRMRFLQDPSGNGVTVEDCADFWTSGWADNGPSWPFYVPPAARMDFLDDLAGDVGENRFCTNFRLINDVGRELREVWIIVDGVTIPGVRALVQDAPRVIPAQQDGEPDIILEPNSIQGMFRYGNFGLDEEIIGQWYFYFGGADVADFRIRGQIVEILREQCGTGSDDNGDGIVDSGCQSVPAGQPCTMRADCVSFNCEGGEPGEPGEGVFGTCGGGPPPLGPGEILIEEPQFNGTPVGDEEPYTHNRWDGLTVEFDAYASLQGCDGCTLNVALGLYSPQTHHVSGSNACVELNTEGDFQGGLVSLTEGISINVNFPMQRYVYEIRAHVSEPDEDCGSLRGRIPQLQDPDAGTLIGVLDLVADPACRPETAQVIISNVRLNSVQQESITVAPGSAVQVEYNYAHKGSSTSCSGCVTPLTINFNGTRRDCVHQMVPPTSCPGTTGSRSFNVTVPTEPGFYPLYTRTSWVFSCNDVGQGVSHGRWNFAVIHVEE